ncbi:MAG: enoyl-CoA hydratase/isomerase family protein [Nitrospinota bacterium]
METKTAEPELVTLRKEGDGIAIIELNNPPANTFSYDMMHQLDETILDVRFDESIHVIILRGAGDKFFCAGADVNLLYRYTPERLYYFCLHIHETLTRLENTPKLVIAALSGHTVGGGLEVAMACDIRLAKRGSGVIGLPERRLGVLPGSGGTQRLPRLIGKSRAMELIIKGKTFPFEEAEQMGLVNEIYAPEEFWDKVMEYARDFILPETAVKAVGNVKRAIQSGLEASIAEGLAIERELQLQLFRSEDAREGVSAFIEKRTPRFKGD